MNVLPHRRLDFDDVLINPIISSVGSRSDVDTSVKIVKQHEARSWSHTFNSPIVIANMDATGTKAMAEAIGDNATVAFHKFSHNNLLKYWPEHFYSMGTTAADISKLHEFVPLSAGTTYGKYPNLICIDVANAYTQKNIDAISSIVDTCRDSIIMAGNVATSEGADRLFEAGVDIVKVGIGPGSVCETRSVTGVGVPQLSAILGCAYSAEKHNKYICADGGCRTPGDVAKALGAGADLVMIGGMFAGTDECEGEWYQAGTPGQVTFGKKKFKFYGMASKEAQEKHYGELKNYRSSEGRSDWVDAKGPAKDVLNHILGGIRSAMTYTNSKNLAEFRQNCQFIEI